MKESLSQRRACQLVYAPQGAAIENLTHSVPFFRVPSIAVSIQWTLFRNACLDGSS